MIPAWIDGRLEPVEKLRVHREGLRHKAVSVFVLHGDHMLIQRRALSKYHTPGLWANACCTHPKVDEPALTCARRRLGEELGLVGSAPVHRHSLEYRADVGAGLTEHEVVDVFVLHLPERPALAPNPAEVMDLRWIGFDQLRDALARDAGHYTPWLQIYMREHSAAIFSP